MATTRFSQVTTALTTLYQRFSPRCLIVAGISIVTGVGLMASNPSRSHYTQYAANQLRDRIRLQCDDLKGNIQAFLFSIPMRDACEVTESGVDLAAARTLEPVINHFTEPRRYYVLFSVYTTDVPLVGRFNTVAVAGQFITWETE